MQIKYFKNLSSVPHIACYNNNTRTITMLPFTIFDPTTYECSNFSQQIPKLKNSWRV